MQGLNYNATNDVGKGREREEALGHGGQPATDSVAGPIPWPGRRRAGADAGHQVRCDPPPASPFPGDSLKQQPMHRLKSSFNY